jgi:YggT family protein
MISLLTATLTQFLSIYIVLIIVRLLMTWFPMSDWAQKIAGFLSIVTDPYLNLFRSLIPPVGGFDFSAILAILLLQVLQSFVQQLPALLPLPY